MASSIRYFSAVLAQRKIGLIAAILCLLYPFAARADLNSDATPKLKKKKPEPTGIIMPTAIAQPTSAEVNRARDVLIRLTGVARGSGQVEFRLQQKPSHGRIISSKPVGFDSLDVLYRHSGDERSESDSFVFAVRSGGIGPFSPGEVRIRIIDPPGSLLAPESIPFPATLAGEIATEEFVVLNEGGQALRGLITVPSPWHLRDAASYQLAPGQKRKITLHFAPSGSGKFSGNLIFEGERPVTVELTGEGLAPFDAGPAKIKLLPGLDGQRSGSISLQNNTAETVSIQVSSPLTVSPSISLQFGETRELVVSDNGIGPIESSVTLKSGTYSTRVAVTAEETPASAPTSTSSTSSTSSAPTPEPTPSPTSVVTTANPAPVTPPVVESTPAEEPAASPATSYPAQTLAAKITPLGRSTIRIDWTLPLPGAAVVIEQRYLTLDARRQLQTQWVDVPSARIESKGKTGRAIIGDLDAGDVFTFRVRQTLGNGQPALTSIPLVYKTAPGLFASLTWRSFFFPIGTILLGFVVWKRWQAYTQTD